MTFLRRLIFLNCNPMRPCRCTHYRYEHGHRFQCTSDGCSCSRFVLR